ncbi:MAG: rhodanese-like domain-containing protein [Bacteroidota bacterium]|nr:rhodanese-like domain-containing protein [Bacteroidota bacterium]
MKSIYGLILSLFLNAASLYSQIPDSLKFQSLGPHDFQLQYQKTDYAILIDVREPFEFKGKRIKGAINIPTSGNIERAADTLNTQYTLFLYCTSGVRSSRVAKTLYDKGFRNLISLRGGIVAWRKERMPVIKGRSKKGIG